MRIVVAVLLAVAAYATWREAGHASALAESHEQLATLRFTEIAAPPATPLHLVPSVAGARRDEDAGRDATVAYWLARYADVMKIGTAGSSSDPVPDPALLKLAANAAYRSAMRPRDEARQATLQALEGVMQAYATAMKNGGFDRDAAYNYELVARRRDAIARARQPRPGEKPEATVRAPVVTIHGAQGAHPVNPDGSEFEILTPMEYGEREAQPEQTPGRKLPRKG